MGIALGIRNHDKEWITGPTWVNQDRAAYVGSHPDLAGGIGYAANATLQFPMAMDGYSRGFVGSDDPDWWTNTHGAVGGYITIVLAGAPGPEIFASAQQCKTGSGNGVWPAAGGPSYFSMTRLTDMNKTYDFKINWPTMYDPENPDQPLYGGIRVWIVVPQIGFKHNNINLASSGKIFTSQATGRLVVASDIVE